MQTRLLAKIIFRYCFYVVIMALLALIDASPIVLGFLIIIPSLLFCIWLLKRKMLISPMLPAEVLLICFGLYKMSLVTTMRVMDLGPSILIVLSIFLWQIICCFNKNIYTSNTNKLVFNINVLNLKTLIFVLFAISSFCILVEWYRAGGIPILRSNAETIRFSVSFSSVWHILAMSIKYVPMFSCIYWMAKGRIDKKRDAVLILISLISLLFLLGTAQRGELLSAPAIIIFAYMSYKKPKVKTIVILACVGALFMGVYPLYRGYNMYGDSYILSIMSISRDEKLWYLTPVYQTFAYSFSVLDKDFSLFPSTLPFGLGGYTFLCNIPFVDLHESLATTQNLAWNNNFYSELTPTFFGDWYADFGFFGFFLGITVICLMLNYFYNVYSRRQDASSLALYAFNFYKCICMLYDNTFDFIWFTYMILVWSVFKLSRRTARSYE